MKDNINPSHYKKGDIQVIDFINAVLDKDADAYYIGNVIKYVSRWKNKGGVEDLKKAHWYLGDLIKRIEK